MPSLPDVRARPGGGAVALRPLPRARGGSSGAGGSSGGAPARRSRAEVRRAQRRNKPPTISWGYGAQKPNGHSVERLVPITAASSQNAGTVGRAVTPGMVFEPSSPPSSSPSSRSSPFPGGYAPLPAPASPSEGFFEPDATEVFGAGSSAGEWATDHVPLALSASHGGHGWLNGDKTSDSALCFYADMYADTRPPPPRRRRQPPHALESGDSLVAPSPIPMLLDGEEGPSSSRAPAPMLLLEPEAEPEPHAEGQPEASPPPPSPVGPSPSSPGETGAALDAATESGDADDGPPPAKAQVKERVCVLWKMVRAQQKKIARANSRDMVNITRTWIDLEQERAAVQIQAFMRGRQGRLHFRLSYEKMLETVVGLQRMRRAKKNSRGQPPAMLWTAILAVLADKEKKAELKAAQQAAKEIHEKEDNQQEPESAEMEAGGDNGELSPTATLSKRTPTELVHDFLATRDSNATIEQAEAIVLAFKAAKLMPSRWISELQDMALQSRGAAEGSRVLEDFFLPACLSKMQRQGSQPPPTDDDDSEEEDEEEEDDEDEEEENEKRLAAIAEAHRQKKIAEGKLKVVINMSKVVLDVKPWDDETNMEELEALVRGIKHATNPNAIEWQASQLEDIGYGIKKLRIMVQVIDDEVSVDEDLVDVICGFEDHVQSCDIFAFNKV